MYTGLEYSNTGLQAIRAVLTAFALAGQLDVPGGIGLAMRGTHFPINRSGHLDNPDLDRAVARDKFPLYSNYRGESHASGLVEVGARGRAVSHSRTPGTRRIAADLVAANFEVAGDACRSSTSWSVSIGS